MVSGSGRGEGHRRRRCKYTTGENVHRKEGRQSREMHKSVHSMANGEERGRQARRRFPRKTTDSRVRGRSSGRRSPTRARRGQQKTTSPTAHRKGGTGRSRQTEKRKRRNTRYFSPRMPPLSVLHAGGEYLGVVANIITQADEAGFELLGTQRAGVILGPPCARQRAMRCQGGGGREGRGWAMPRGKGRVCGETQGQRHADGEGRQWMGWGRKGNKSAHG